MPVPIATISRSPDADLVRFHEVVAAPEGLAPAGRRSIAESGNLPADSA
jgi:hypothetical protein